MKSDNAGMSDRIMRRKFFYFSNSVFPSQRANNVQVIQMCEALTRFGYQVTLVCYRTHEVSEEEIFDAYGVVDSFRLSFIEVQSERYKFFRSLLQFIMLAMKIPKDAIIYGRDVYPLIMCAFFGRFTSYEVHGDPMNSIENLATNLLVKLPNLKKIVAISNGLATRICERYHLTPAAVLVAHDGCNQNQISSEVVSNKAIRDVGYIGSLDVSGRGVDVVLYLAERHPELNFHLVGGHAHQVDYWQRRASKNVTFHGFVKHSEVSDKLEMFDIALMPYQYDLKLSGSKVSTIEYMSPMKMFEYMAAAKIIISSDLPVLREVLDESNSYLVQCDRYADWSSAIKKIVEDPAKARLKAQGARKLLEAEFTWNARVERLLDGGAL